MFSDLLQRVVKPRSRANVRRERTRCLRLEPLESRCLLKAIPGYSATDLAADQPGIAPITDSDLVNGWGVALSPTGEPIGGIWVSSNGKDLSTIYTGDVGGSPLSKDSTVSIAPGQPTGLVFNGTSDFVLHSVTSSEPATFIFASQSGEVYGWNSQVGSKKVFPPASNDANYTGIALAKDDAVNYLYLADFHNNKIDVLDSSFHLMPNSNGQFEFNDPRLSPGYSPFNVAAIEDTIYVAYAKKKSTTDDEVDTCTNCGIINKFDTNGNFLERLVSVGSKGQLTAPWAMVQAPNGFGTASGCLLVGNFGNGQVNAYDSEGTLQGTLSDSRSRALKIGDDLPGFRLRGLAFGNGTDGDTTSLYYAAGWTDTDGTTHGLFGKIFFGTSAVTASLAGDTLTITGTRNRDNVRVTREGARQQIVVRADGKQIGTFDPAQVGIIHFHGWAGDDSIVISPSVKATAILDGGAGNDRLIAGGGNSILLGGLGNDFLHATFGRNVLIGGEGRDSFQGGIHDDLLIAGPTAHDADTAALLQILAEWTSADSYNTRVSKLRNGTGGLPKLDATTVFDDGARDFLLGNGGLDWFFASTDDKLADRRSNEQRQ